MLIYVFGNNQDGQLGVPCLQDYEPKPVCNESLENVFMERAAVSLRQTGIITKEGVVLTSGANDQNELGRSGKRSIFARVDILETFRVRDICYGRGFCVVVLFDGRVMAWGQNDMGQLGDGTREYREKVRFSLSSQHKVLQVSVGAQHVLALTREGSVIAWGGNRHGQLGNGQFTSSTTANEVIELRHRPVISVACGENHCLVLTRGGSVYSWGDNSQGQLGLGDRKNRLRPELIRTLKTAGIVKIAAGGQHSIALTELSNRSSTDGLMFTFGSNSFGQLGHQDFKMGVEDSSLSCGDRVVVSPTLCERLSERFAVIDGTCGKAHTIVVCKERSELLDLPEDYSCGLKVFAMGLNSMGQCGICNTQSVSRPTQIIFSPPQSLQSSVSRDSNIVPRPSTLLGFDYVYTHSGPLSNHSIVGLSTTPIGGYCAAPSVDVALLENAAEAYRTKKDAMSLTNLREVVANSFSSLSVLNSSFRYQHHDKTSSQAAFATLNGGVMGAAIGLDLDTVRHAYKLVTDTENSQVVNTLGRATMAVSNSLKECPFDDPENLFVFLIVLENPLLLKPDAYHVVLQRVVSGILAIPHSYRLMVFGWMKQYPSEYFMQIVQVMQSYLDFVLLEKSLKLDPVPVVLVIESLYECNAEARIVPNSSFHNHSVELAVDIIAEWEKFQTHDSTTRIFNFFSYPYLLSVEAKNRILRLEFQKQKAFQASKHIEKYLGDMKSNSESPFSRLPFGVVPSIITIGLALNHLSLKLELHINRENLLSSLISQLTQVIHSDPLSLYLPISVKFDGENDTVDEGGVTRELFSLAIRDFVLKKKCLGMSGVMGERLFFVRTSNSDSMSQGGESGVSFSDEFMLGVIVSLACYNNVMVNLPLVHTVYKLFKNQELTLDDLWAADHELAKSIQTLLEYSGDDCMCDIFGLDFTAPKNPLINDVDSSSPPEFVELMPNGSTVEVDRGNRLEFSRLFVTHALYFCCKEAIDDFLKGLHTVLSCQALKLFTSDEVEQVFCGTSHVGDLSELRRYTEYAGEFHDKHPVIEIFWSVLSELSSFDQKRFLNFVTATDRIPVGGLSEIRLTIQPTHQSEEALPVAHTCFNVLDLPLSYLSKSLMKQRIKTALDHSQGFGLV